MSLHSLVALPSCPVPHAVNMCCAALTHRLFRCVMAILLLSCFAAQAEQPFLPNLATLQEPGQHETTNTPAFLSAEDAFVLSWVAHDDGWTVSFTIEPGYYLYQDRTRLSAIGATLPASRTPSTTSGGVPVISPTHTATPNPTHAASSIPASMEHGSLDPLIQHTLTQPPRLSFQQAADTKFDKNFGLVQVFHDRLDIEVIHAGHTALVLTWQGCSEQQLCYPPQTLTLNRGESRQDTIAVSGQLARQASLSPFDITTPITSGLLSIWREFIAIGLSLIFTSCVLPLIAMIVSLVSIIGSAAPPGTRMSRHYGLGLAMAFVFGTACSYAVIGILATTIGAGINLVAMAQTPWAIGSVAALLAMMGLYLSDTTATGNDPTSDPRSAYVQTGPSFLSAPPVATSGFRLSSFAIGFIAALIVSPCISDPIGSTMMTISNGATPLMGGTALFAMGLAMGIPILISGAVTGYALPWLGEKRSVLQVACGIALMAVALVLLDRVIADHLTMGMAGLLALYVGLASGALDIHVRPTRLSQRLHHAFALLCLVFGLLWTIGAAMGNTRWLQPLASATL